MKKKAIIIEPMIIEVPKEHTFMPPIISNRKVLTPNNKRFASIKCNISESEADLTIDGPIGVDIHITPNIIMKIIDKIKNAK